MQEDPIPPVPKPLNEPVRLYKWTLQEIVRFFVVFAIVWMTVSLVLGLMSGIVSVWLGKLLQNSPYGDLTKKGKYWFFPNNGKYSTLVPSHIREMVG